MADVVDLQKWRRKPTSTQMFEMTVFMDPNGMLEVSMDIEEDFTDYEIFEAIIAAAYKYAEDTGLAEDEEGPSNDNE